MEQLTAMEQLIEWIDSDCTPMDCVMKAKELLKVEKEQIIKAWEDGKGSFSTRQAEQYYNEVYGGQGSPDTSPNT